MMILTVARAAAAAVTATLALSSGRNMVQTFQVSREHQRSRERSLSSSIPAPPIHRFSLDSQATTASVVKQIEQMNRKELVEVFLSCEAPTDLSEIQGEWNGVLLDNNGFVMTRVTSIITNVLFGKGRRWNGKAFSGDGDGVNRFHAKSEQATTETEHPFDYALEPTRFVGASGESVLLSYNAYQPPLSLWCSMKDEVRILLPLLNHAAVDGQVLLGMGSMTWSGGWLNASPFCLWRDVDDSSVL